MRRLLFTVLLLLSWPAAADYWRYAQNLHKRVFFEDDGIVVRCEIIFPDSAWKESEASEELKRACELVAEEVAYINRARVGKVIGTEVGEVFFDVKSDQLMLVIKVLTDGNQRELVD